mgnify:FL=1
MPRFRRPLLIGAGAIGCTVVAAAAANRAAELAYAHWRAPLQRSLSTTLGQPVQLGPYAGLRPWGLIVGPSRITPQGDSRSRVSIGSLELKLAPLASLRQGLLALDLTVRQARVELRPNRRGQYWVLGQRRQGLPPPRLALLLRLSDPAEVELSPNRSRWRVSGALQLQLRQRRLALQAWLRPRNERPSGALQTRLTGDWSQRQWQLGLNLQRLALADLSGLLPTRVALTVPGLASGRVGLRWRAGAPSCQGQLEISDLLWRPQQPERRGPGTGLGAARLRCEAQTLTLAPTTLQVGAWQARASGHAQWRPGRGLQIAALEVSRGPSWIRSRGWLGRSLDLQSRWRLRPVDLPGGKRLPGWLQQTPLQGDLQTTGPWRRPQLALTVSRTTDPLLGPWSASLRWRDGMLRLLELRSAALQASGSLPLTLGRRFHSGALQLDLALRNFPLQRLQPLLGAPLQGQLQASGRIQGPLTRLVPELQLQLDTPAAGPLRLAERWQGQWHGQQGGGGLLELWALAPAPEATLSARLNRRWLPTEVSLWRGQGKLNLQGSPKQYRWRADKLLLDGLIVRLGERPQAIAGELSGNGLLNLQPLSFSGDATLQNPLVLGLRLQSAHVNGSYQARRYALKAELQLKGRGHVSGEAQGRWHGPFALRGTVRGLEGDSLRQLADLWPLWHGGGLKQAGRAKDLGSLLIATLGESVEQQLAALERARAAAAGPRRRQPLQQLQAHLDADISLQGPSLARANLELTSTGHLWTRTQDSDQALTSEPFVLRLQGPLQGGQGSFSIAQLPLALLTLLTPVPEGLRGSLAIEGRYRLGRRSPELALQLSSQQAHWGATPLTLQRGSIALAGPMLKIDLALHADGAQSNVELAGVLPLDPNSRNLELRLASRGDGLRFLTALAEPDLSWQKGNLDLQLLLRGSLNDPIANGFLRVQNGQLRVLNQTVEALDATVVFDFEQLLVQQLSAKVGARGRLSAAGHLGLLEPSGSEPPLEVEIRTLPFNLPRIQAVADGRLQLRGSLRNLKMGGDLSIDQGSINAQPGRLMSAAPGKGPQTPRKGVSQLLQEQWDFQSPLLLVGSEVETNSSQRVLESVPRFAALGFDGLAVKLGPNLKIVIPNAATFKTAGVLRLSGNLDPSLRARGVVRLLQGRLNLFTSSFSLDPEAPNVAIFTPALGLIPYLDIAMRTRVSDNLAMTGLGRAGTPSVAEIEAQGGLNSLSQLNLVRITVSVQGPADRLGRSIRLRSSPPMPESRLIALIGGNSLAGLSGSGAGAAIATVVGQTLLSPVLGGLSDAFGQRLSFALYPTYVNPNVTNSAVLRSQRLAPQLVLGSEIGVDITDRFNASVLAAPNRSDVPPQLNLNVRASDLITIQGAVDTQGAWQTQLQLFFRF